MRRAYQSDLSDEEWSFLEPLLPAPTATWRPKAHSTREFLNAIYYIVGGGCAWRLLAHEIERKTSADRHPTDTQPQRFAALQKKARRLQW